ncbi:MAG: A/G-specific adenine glycosylase [Gallionella sp.]|nr:A/G-specific adenine glycosylase [Gallionella sp.]MDD4947469.1 A/G-specific adenine glycosylase [Gallionella sp.]MDD5611520.1 A/G-specific adenine glycosylase [Gallionella sp.]
MSSFATSLIVWQREHGRHDLPWQGGDAYRVWLSEIMLQQTQVATVIPYYRRFIAAFPSVAALADASEEQVLAHWSGLGYYARGRNLHRAARLIVTRHEGEFPQDYAQILDLPGIGRSTAAAICAQAYHQPHAILDGNVKRVLARYCGIEGWPGEKAVEARLWQQAEALLPERDVACYTQALMDMGATLCSRSKPNCAACPVQAGCVAFQARRVIEFPAQRPRKALPERRATLLLVMAEGRILLEKRGPAGIWGGLWCLPQREEGDEELAEYAACSGWKIAGQSALPGFTHTFTHFRLHISPLRFDLEQLPLQASLPGREWMAVSDALAAAIPTPVRRLLEPLVEV